MKRLLYTFFFLSLQLTVFAQAEPNTWYFGNGVGLDFSWGTPVAITDAALFTNEGCAVATNANGDILFYSNGIEVYDRTHQRMANGESLLGTNSSTQSCVIVPKPGDSKLFYIFTVDEMGGANGLTYSIVDMDRNSGRGDVIEKNKPLLAGTTEKLTVVPHCNQKDYWILTHKWNSNAFYSLLLTAQGVSDMFVSRVGRSHKDEGSGNNSEAIGYLRASPDGKKLACVINKVGNNNVELFDFNASTGEITNPYSMSVDKNVYGACFSPNGSRLYLSFETGSQGVTQYDLSGIRDISKTWTFVGPKDGRRYGAMQIGPDGKIYVAVAGTDIDVIEKPNELGTACAYKKEKVSFGYRYSTFGLPEIIRSSSGTDDVTSTVTDTVICSIPFTLEAAGSPSASYAWSTGQKTKSVDFINKGLYQQDNLDLWVKVSDGACGNARVDTFHIEMKKPYKVWIGEDTALCADSYTLDASDYKDDQLLWSTGETSTKITVKESGKYWVQVMRNGCAVRAYVKVDFSGREPRFVPLKEFTPNNDGFNDRFDYIIRGMDEFLLQVFKGNKLLYQTTNPREKWDGKYKGKAVKKGEYKWKVTYKTHCKGNEEYKLEGKVLIVN